MAKKDTSVTSDYIYQILIISEKLHLDGSVTNPIRISPALEAMDMT